MARQFAFADGNAKAGGAKMGTGMSISGNIQPTIIETLKTIFPVKTWGYVASLLCIEERCAKHRVSGDRAFTADELAIMLRSEHGLTFLSAVMADAKPRWWVSFRQRVAISDARRHEAAARLKLQEALDAEADLTTTIARADMLLDQDFMRPHSDALRTMGRVPDSAVAKTTKR